MTERHRMRGGGGMTTRHSPEFCWSRGKIGHPLSLDEGDFDGDHLSHKDQDGLMLFLGAKANEYIAASLLRLKTGSGLCPKRRKPSVFLTKLSTSSFSWYLCWL